MKRSVLILTIACSGCSIAAMAQQSSTITMPVVEKSSGIRRLFTTVAIVPHKQYPKVIFTVAGVHNVRCYRIEAGNDTAGMELIGRIAAKANTVLPESYTWLMNEVPTAHKYYRVIQESMNYEWVASPVITSPTGHVDSSLFASRQR